MAQIDRVYCDPEFKKLLKKQAIDAGFNSTLDFTREFAKRKKMEKFNIKQPFDKNKKPKKLRVDFDVFW